MPNLPCTTHGVTACPYLDRKGNAPFHGQSHWTCCGVQGEGPKRLVLMRECPQIEVVRKMWREGRK